MIQKKDIIGAERNYEIWSDGTIFSKALNRPLKPRTAYNGYIYNLLHIHGKGQKRLTIHRLVAQHFIPNPENKRCVNHINGIKSDNRVENLEWATHSENNAHAHRTGLMDNSFKRVKVSQYTQDGVFVKEYDSVDAAGIDNGVDPTYISRQMRGIFIPKRGFIYKYSDLDLRVARKRMTKITVGTDLSVECGGILKNRAKSCDMSMSAYISFCIDRTLRTTVDDLQIELQQFKEKNDIQTPNF